MCKCGFDELFHLMPDLRCPFPKFKDLDDMMSRPVPTFEEIKNEKPPS